ncbi:MAG: MbtH family NRPS accessory protein [Paracoccus sp. (in: a-proteobacteria)]|uniref:MbtH family NRPS accessory protein n=1 Tax=Paracoccus sp. TaxID=267 RepID=UPI0026DFBD17|nr:MbtH family NRPS accessory protein [Paracoccus sp. (in: a-proteobacteria)]MDO5611883.1 MbtH family NRPS accessory protein [Paracoccus sp. (in: a-proteobacteria)]
MTEYLVVTAEDGRYSIWPAFRTVPWGWAASGFRGSRDDCLAHIAAVWTELRPKATP